MPNSGRFNPPPVAAGRGDLQWQAPVCSSDGDLRVPLYNLSTVQARMDSVQRFLHESVNSNTLIATDKMEMISTEISSAIHQIIVSGAALLACSQSQNPRLTTQLVNDQIPSTSSILEQPTGMDFSGSDLKFKFGESDGRIQSSNGICFHVENKQVTDMKLEVHEEKINDVWDIIELDAVELLAEHIHFCNICGKGFKRDANLRMHMRAHGNQFKTTEALLKPGKIANSPRKTRFSCPYSGCNRNQSHKKFRPLKSVICVKNHFKRSHCPKMYSCDRCHKKNFSVLADLKSHLKHCGEAKWKCSCGTSFSRKDKLFGHMALFEGHMPAVMEEEEKVRNINSIEIEDEVDEDQIMKDVESVQLVDNGPENGFFDGVFDGFSSVENFCIQDFLDSPNGGLGNGMNWFL